MSSGVGSDDLRRAGLFDLVIAERGSRPILVINQLRVITGLGLGEAKALSELPCAPVLRAAAYDVASAAATRLSDVGATVLLIRNHDERR